MSFIQNITGEFNKIDKLCLRWEIYSDPVALLLQLSEDSKFTKRTSFLLPVTTGCNLDVEKGNWFVRIGVFIGSTIGNIEWSGVYGPFSTAESNTIIPVKKEIPIIYTRSVENGIRLHTDHIGPLYAILEYISSHNVKKTIYTCDIDQGYILCTGLDDAYTYSIRMTTFKEFPKDAILRLSDGVTIHNKRSMKPMPRHSSTDRDGAKGETAFLIDISRQKNVKFRDYGQYMVYLASKEATVGKLEHV